MPHCLGNNDEKRLYPCSVVPNYIVHISLNATFFSSNIFNPCLVESMDLEHMDTEGRLLVLLHRELQNR